MEREFDLKAFGKRLAYIRRRLGLKQKDLADLTGRTAAAVSAWEVGKGIMPVDIFAKLVKVYKINPLWLLFGESPVFLEDISARGSEENSIYSVAKLEKKFLLIRETAEDMIKSGEYQTSAGKKLKKLLDELLSEGNEK